MTYITNIAKKKNKENKVFDDSDRTVIIYVSPSVRPSILIIFCVTLAIEVIINVHTIVVVLNLECALSIELTVFRRFSARNHSTTSLILFGLFNLCLIDSKLFITNKNDD